MATQRKKQKNKYLEKVKDGNYLKLPNEVIEKVYHQYFRVHESKIFWFIVRKTWGWGKHSEFINLRQFNKELGLHKSHICRALSALKQRGIVISLGNKTYAIQMDTNKWKDNPKKSSNITSLGNKNSQTKNQPSKITDKHKKEKLPNKVKNITSLGNNITSLGNKTSRKSSSKADRGTPKNTILKDTIKKDNSRSKKLAKTAAVSSLRFSGEERDRIRMMFTDTGWETLSESKISELINMAVAKGKEDVWQYFRFWKKEIDKKKNVHNKPGYLIKMVEEGDDPPRY